MNNILLPLGTILYLNEGIKKVMIVSRGAVIETDEGNRLLHMKSMHMSI